MWKRALISSSCAIVCMTIVAGCIVAFMMQIAGMQPAVRDWSTLRAFSDDAEALQRPEPPGAVVVNNVQAHILLTAGGSRCAFAGSHPSTRGGGR